MQWLSIPIYQRNYSWTEQQREHLWNDILRAGERDDIKRHFIGSIVCIEKNVSNVTHKAPLLLIDGQQRLTTITRLLPALSRALGNDEPVDGVSREKIAGYCLCNQSEKEDRHCKL